MIDLTAARALAEAARSDTSDGLEAREALIPVALELIGEAEAARRVRVLPRSIEPLIDREKHSPAKVRAYLAAHGWTLFKEYEECSEWMKPDATRPGWIGEGSVVMVLDSARFSDYGHHLAMTVTDLAGLHGMGELAVLAGIEAAGA